MRLRADGLGAMVQGAALVFVLAYLDAAWEDVVMTSTVVIGPFLTAMFASARNDRGRRGVRRRGAIVSGGYNDNYGSREYFVQLLW